ncbi:MAG: GNAT family N-acetyltransferase [Ruminococcaceae bacterium]|nr:GNAT family N-acetyltransferase [Oscillospiraceae bacterium]
MTNQDILDIALRQAAIDSGCAPEDFLRTEPVVVTSRPHPDARRYLALPLFLDLTSYGSNIVASCDPRIADFARKFIDRPDIEHCYESTALYELNDELAKYGQRIRHMAEYWLPDVDALERAITANICPLPTKLLTPPDFDALYLPEWSNALCESRRELDVLGVGAFDGERMVGFAACSADGADMWQIGIDVLPDYRRRGIAKALVTQLAWEILDRGKVPFYCCAWANVKSARCAAASGFYPAWMAMTAKPIA